MQTFDGFCDYILNAKKKKIFKRDRDRNLGGKYADPKRGFETVFPFSEIHARSNLFQ